MKTFIPPPKCRIWKSLLYIDHSLIPTDIQAWYVDSSDEEDTVSERESDLETEEPSDVSHHDSEAATN